MSAINRARIGRLCKRTVLILCLISAACLVDTQAQANLKSKVVKKVMKSALKKMAKTAMKKYIPVVNVATTAYEATQFAMESIDLYNSVGQVIEGVAKGRPWAVSYVQVVPKGWQVQAKNDTSVARSELVDAEPLSGNAAYSNSAAWKYDGRVQITGYSQGSASWLGMGGIGGTISLGGEGLKTIVVARINQRVDPFSTPVINPNDQPALAQEVQLLEPSGFDYFVRVYYPTSSPDSVGPLFYEAEVFGYLEFADSTAHDLSDAIRPAVYSIADYYDRAGNSINHLEGLDVSNLAPDSFAYYEADTARSYQGYLVPTYGYALKDFDLKFNVNMPAEWSSNGKSDDQYVCYDFQVIEGGASQGGYGPQWDYRDLDLFQDNFPTDNYNIESYVRADMAQDINSMGSGIHPGDSIVVTCFDVFSGGIAEDQTMGGGPAIYLHARCSYIGAPPEKPLISGSVLQGTYGRFKWIDAGGWTIIQADTARTQEGIIENKFMVDLNDSLFTRGYVIEYYFSATSNNGAISTLPQDAANEDYFEFTGLPTLHSDILYVRSFPRTVQDYFTPTFAAVLTPNNIPDRYDVNYPASLASNGLGSRAPLQYLMDTYWTIVWDSGNIPKGTISDCTPATDKSPDCQLLVDWMNLSPHDVGLWVCGDNVADELSRSASASALELLNSWCGVSFVNNSYFDLTGGRTGGGATTPIIEGAPTGILYHYGVPDQFYADGHGITIKQFDVLEKTADGDYALDYPAFNATAYHAGIQAARTNAQGYTVRTMWFGFSFQSIRDMTRNAPIIRNHLAYDVFSWMQHETRMDISWSDVPAAYHLGQNHPNPFNPSTAIAFDMKQKDLVTIKIYNVAGQLVRTLVNEVKDKGSHTVAWDGTNDVGNTVASGIYFYEMEAGEFSQSKKMILIR
jgi:hypothetical protein